MTNLLWPGDERAGELMTDPALLRAMVAVESAWLGALVQAGLAPVGRTDLGELLAEDDTEPLARGAEAGGNPVLDLVALLRRRANPALAPYLHRGLTSQDVLDTAIMLALSAVAQQVKAQLAEQISALSALAGAHRATPMVARTLTQQAAPTTFGVKVAGWLDGIVDAYTRLRTLATPAQFGGAVGTYAATVELVTLRTGTADPAVSAEHVARSAATALGLDFRAPWHTNRAPITAFGDALVACTDSWGRVASDVVTLARPEIGELSEPAGRGGSSSMPHKHNPVLAILIRRAAIAAPPLAATLHTAAALANDERPDGAWHAEWDTLRTLARRTVVAGSQCSELVAGLVVHTDAMAENLAGADVLGEQRAIAELTGEPPSSSYLGAAGRLTEASLQRARRTLDG